MFEIRFTENEQLFYPLGKLQTFDLRSEKFEYGNEYFDTGNTFINTIMNSLSMSVVSGNTSSGANSVVEAINWDIQTESDTILDFTDNDPFAEGDF